VAALAYNAAVQAALAYAETVHVAFDLHRADLLTALRMTPPGRHDAERTLNEQWCDHWRQGIPLPATLHYTQHHGLKCSGSREVLNWGFCRAAGWLSGYFARARDSW
jgi:hypothetical protein